MTPTRPLRLALAVWTVFAVALAVRVLHRPTSHTVFPLFAAAAEHWWADVPLYAEHPPLDYYRYPPLFAILFTPFAWCGPALGGVLWSWLNLGVYLWGLTALTRVLPGKWDDRRRAGFLLVALAGGLPALWNGQCNALVAGLVLLGTSALTRRRWLATGLLLATAVVLKLVPLPLALLFCALWPPLAPRFLAALAAGLLLPFLTRPAATVVEAYRGLAAQSERLSAERWPGFRDLWTAQLVLGRLAEGKTGLPDLKAPLTSLPYRGLQCAGGLAVLVLCWRLGRRRPVGERAALVLGLGACWLMLLGPSSEPPTYVFLAPALAWGAVQRDRWPAGRGWATAAALLVLGPGWGGLTRPWWDACPLLLLPLPAAAACLAVWLVGQAVRSRRYESACTGRVGPDRIVLSAAESAAAGPPSGGPNGPGSAGPGAKVQQWTGVLSSPSPSANLAGRPGQCPGRI